MNWTCVSNLVYVNGHKPEGFVVEICQSGVYYMVRDKVYEVDIIELIYVSVHIPVIVYYMCVEVLLSTCERCVCFLHVSVCIRTRFFPKRSETLGSERLG